MLIRSHHGFHAAFALAALVLIVACAGDQQLAPGQVGPPRSSLAPAPSVTPANREIILATTTSTQDSGLLDALVPLFQEQTGYRLKPIAIGSGAALELGRRGEADVLLVHSPAAEQDFMAEGLGTERRTVMVNDFIIVGPPSDPAGIAGAPSALEAMARIATAEAPFVSRGDESGTNALELQLWRQVSIAPAGAWYTESGTGMGDTLNIANERQAYTLADRGTYLALRDRLELDVLVEHTPELLNIYHVITVNPANGPAVNTAGADAFVTFLLDPATQRVIGEFGVERFGQPLFTPCAGNACGVEAAATPVA